MMFTKEIAETFINKDDIPEYHPHWRAVGYLEAIEKAEELVKALNSIIRHQEHVSETMAELSITSIIAKKVLAKWEKIK